MGRTKGAKNKNSGEVPVYSALPVEERLFVLANLIVDRIVEDQIGDRAIFRQIGGNHAAAASATP